MSHPEIEEIARINRDSWAGKVLYAITVEGGWFTVHEHGPDGVWPQSTYATPHEAVSRVAQLMGVRETISPQDWPERACIGRVE